MLKADWQAIAEEYITGEISMRSLAIKYALPRSTLRSLVRRAEEILDGPESVGARELGELMRAIKNAKEIRMLRSELDEREQRARLRTLEEKSAAADRTLQIEFAPDVEEAAR